MLSRGSLALAVVRVPRGVPRPTHEHFRAALDEDRRRLHLPSGDPRSELVVTGPSAVMIDHQALDEYVVWER